jgi:hypothetical protein
MSWDSSSKVSSITTYGSVIWCKRLKLNTWLFIDKIL